MRKLALLILIGSCVSAPAFADSLIQIQAFGISDQTSTLTIQPFNPSLGTLDSVNVTIDGLITGTIYTTPNFAGEEPVPEPYVATISQNFAGSPFTFFSPSQTMVFGTSLGLGETDPIALPFDYGFTFDSFSNLTGFTTTSGSIDGGSSPGLIDGTLNGWQSSILPITIETAVVTGSVEGGAISVIPDLSEDGAVIVQYNYDTSPPAATPEPGTLSLIACGLAGLLLPARRKFAA